jgi:hypothetical protein
MTKNGRRGLFLLVATVLNMLLTVLLLVVMVVLWSLLASLLKISQATIAPAILVSFIASVVLSGFIYSRVLKALRKRPDLEERFGLLK